ncbi:aspartate kinase [Planctomycetota bacterium]|nr:aspartate kinase [Planctomycetota bacterium]
MKVMKFGGSCLQSRDGLERMIDLVRGEPRPLVIVLSALKGVTDWLIRLMDEAEQGTPPALADFRQRHEEVLETLTGTHRESTQAALDERLTELERVLAGIAALQEIPERTRDRILSLGERLSVVLAQGHLTQAGVPARFLVGQEAGMLTTAEPGDARLLPTAEVAVRERLVSEDVVYVVAGFVGHDPQGHLTTLGRGGSDTTATFLAAALKGTAVLWKDTQGLLTGDPSVVDNPKVIQQIHYLDALELAHYGLPAIAEKAIYPARRGGISIEIRSFLEASRPPSVIGNVTSDELAITCVPEVVMLDLMHPGSDMAPGGPIVKPGVERPLLSLARFLEALAEAGVSPLLLTEASPHGETTLAIKTEHRGLVEGALERPDVNLEATLRPDLAAVSLIGSGMRGKIGFAASVFDCLAKAKINIEVIAQTASERNISVVVAKADAHGAVKALHARFVE